MITFEIMGILLEYCIYISNMCCGSQVESRDTAALGRASLETRQPIESDQVFYLRVLYVSLD